MRDRGVLAEVPFIATGTMAGAIDLTSTTARLEAIRILARAPVDFIPNPTRRRTRADRSPPHASPPVCAGFQAGLQ